MRTFVKTYCQSYRMSLAVDRLVPKQHIGNSAVELNVALCELSAFCVKKSPSAKLPLLHPQIRFSCIIVTWCSWRDPSRTPNRTCLCCSGRQPKSGNHSGPGRSWQRSRSAAQPLLGCGLWPQDVLQSQQGMGTRLVQSPVVRCDSRTLHFREPPTGCLPCCGCL